MLFNFVISVTAAIAFAPTPRVSKNPATPLFMFIHWQSQKICLWQWR